MRLGIITTSDIFEGEVYSHTLQLSDIADRTVDDTINLMKAGCWFDSLLGLNDRWKDEYGTLYKDVRYGSNERNLLDIYVPKNLDVSHENGIIISIHGGGWTSGSKEDEIVFCTEFAKLGYITAAINYSYIDFDKKSTMFTIIKEVDLALAKIKSMSDEYGWKITKAALSGGSAGAHISLMYAYANNAGKLPVLFVAEQVAPIDLRYKAWEGLKTTTQETYLQYASAGIGKKITAKDALCGKFDEELLKVSPVNYVSTAVPTIMIHGLYDNVVNPKNGEILLKELKEQGVECDYFACPNCNHLMACDKLQRKNFKEKIKEYLKKYFGY